MRLGADRTAVGVGARAHEVGRRPQCGAGTRPRRSGCRVAGKHPLLRWSPVLIAPPLLDTLSRLPHFRGLGPELLERVASCASERRLARGELLFARGEAARSFFVVHAGAIRLARSSPEGREHVVHRVAPGASFAEAAVLSFGRYPVDAQASEEGTVLVEIAGEPFLRLLREEEQLAPGVIGSLCARLAQLVERVEELSLVQAGSRLARWLLRQPASGPPERLAIELAVHKRELAAHLAMTPETLSRLFRRWQDEGWLEVDRSRVLVLDTARLEAAAD